MSVIFKPRDLVKTPSGRLAEVTNIRADGKRDLEYKDADGGQVALAPSALELVKSATPRPWPSRHAP